MQSFYVMLYSINKKDVIPYDIMPYLMSSYEWCKKRNSWYPLEKEPKEPLDFLEWLQAKCMYEYFARCEYEFIALPWPPGDTDTLEGCKKYHSEAKKIDVWQQIKPNLGVINDIFINNLKEKNNG